MIWPKYQILRHNLWSLAGSLVCKAVGERCPFLSIDFALRERQVLGIVNLFLAVAS